MTASIRSPNRELRPAFGTPPSSPPSNNLGHFLQDTSTSDGFLGTAEEDQQAWTDSILRNGGSTSSVTQTEDRRNWEQAHGQGNNTRRDPADRSLFSLGRIPGHLFCSPPPPQRRSPSAAERDLLAHNTWRFASPRSYLRYTGHDNSQRNQIDLTSIEPEMPSAASSKPQKRSHAQSGGEGPASKRQKQSPRGSRANAIDIEEVDLVEEDGTQALLGEQQEELVKTQQRKEGDEKAKRLGEMNCIICLDNFTNLTATVCGMPTVTPYVPEGFLLTGIGHIFCHECLTQALIAGEKSSERNRGTCPMCRKPLVRTTKGNIIPLNLMTQKKWKSTYEGRPLNPEK